MNRSTFYKCIHHVPSNREIENQKLDADILAIYYDTNCRYGASKICDDLHDRGWHVSLKRVQRRMAAMRILLSSSRNTVMSQTMSLSMKKKIY